MMKAHKPSDVQQLLRQDAHACSRNAIMCYTALAITSGRLFVAVAARLTKLQSCNVQFVGVLGATVALDSGVDPPCSSIGHA